MDGGSGIPAYRDMVDRAVPPLNTAADSDRSLAARISSAAAASEAGSRQLDTIAARVDMLAQRAPAANGAAQQRALLTELRAHVQQASAVVRNTQQVAAQAAEQVRSLKYPSDTPPTGPGGDVHALDDKNKPAPPHGHDPRYWIDTGLIERIPEGELAPPGYVQIGPELWYPFQDNQYSVHPPPDPVKHPLDMHDITQVAPGGPGPWGSSELAPGYFAPDPRKVWDVQPAWPPPQAPIDIRDIIRVPPGELAPWGYREYLPGWWAPDVSHDGFPHLPPRR